MSYSIERHPELPAIIARWHSDFNFSREAQDYVKDMHRRLDEAESPVYYVLDMHEWHDMTLNELVHAANLATRSETSNFHHPNNLGNLVITNDPAVELSVKGLRSDVFGNAKTFIFAKLEDALEYIRREI